MFDRLNIKKIVLWLVVIMVGSFAIAGTIYATQGGGEGFFGYIINPDESGGISYNSMSSEKGSGSNEIKDEKIDVESENFDINGVEDISIDSISENINIIPVDTKEIKAHFHGTYYGAASFIPKLEAQQNKSSIEIIIKHKNGINIGPVRANLKLDVYVPKAYQNNISVKTVSAGLGIKDFNLNTFKYNSVSGDLSASNVETKNTELHTTSGKMIARDFNGNLDFQSISGDIDFEYRDFNNSIKMNTTSGKLKLKLPEKSQFDVSFNSMSGKFSSQIPLATTGSQDKNNFNGSTGNSSNKITASSVSGDFDITK